MGALFKLKIRRKIVLIIIGFTIMASGGLVYISVKSLSLDKEHLTLIEHLKNIDINVSHSRIFLDDYFLFNDTLKSASIISSINQAQKHLALLDSFVVAKYLDTRKANLRQDITRVDKQVKLLKQRIIAGLENGMFSMDILILEKYNDFQINYSNLDKNIHEYILDENSDFKRSIFILVFAIFSLLIISLALIQSLIKTYNTIEKEQATKTIEVEYKERKRIAADLHDGLGSILSSIALFIKLAVKENKNNALNNKLSKIEDLSSIALDNLEAAINNISPSNLERYGLVQALEILIEKINEAGKIDCKLIAPIKNFKCDSNLQINLYRICNELINNTIKHSDATEVLIYMHKIKRTINLIYKDNGKGFSLNMDFTADDEKMGLRNIVNRVESLGGKYLINSEVGNGVEFRFWFKI